MTGPITEIILNKLKAGMTDIALDFITGLPIMIGVSIGVYVLISMFSKKLASLGVIGVFLYGALIVII